MKQFKNLDEAFNHQSHCPNCNEPIEADYKEKVANGSWDTPKIATVFNLTGGDEITIDYYSNEVLSYKEASSYTYTYGINNPTIVAHTGNYNLFTGGTLIFGVSAKCYKCGMYGYSLQVAVDWKKHEAIGIFLNSENVSIEDPDGTVHEIKNTYSTEKTTYDKFARMDIDDGTVKMHGLIGKRDSTITFPLMPLDVKNPRLLLNRIKTLIVFS